MAQDKCAPKEAKKKKFNRHQAWLDDGVPVRDEKGEVIGGGWFVFKRNPKTGRISPARFPFEYPDQDAAQKQAAILSTHNGGDEFIVVQSVASVAVEVAP